MPLAALTLFACGQKPAKDTPGPITTTPAPTAPDAVKGAAVATKGAKPNNFWWPQQLNLQPLRDHAAHSSPLQGFDYAAELATLDHVVTAKGRWQLGADVCVRFFTANPPSMQPPPGPGLPTAATVYFAAKRFLAAGTSTFLSLWGASGAHFSTSIDFNPASGTSSWSSRYVAS